MNEVQLYRAVAQARQDIAEGIDAQTAINTAARRYNVSAGAVEAYAVIAHNACCRAATAVENGRRY